MRFVAFLILFTAVGSIQLPWVSCELGSFHLDLGEEPDCHHDDCGSDEDGEHEAVNWTVVPASHATTASVVPASHGFQRDHTQPVASRSHSAVQARATAPPAVAAERTAVLLL